MVHQNEEKISKQKQTYMSTKFDTGLPRGKANELRTRYIREKYNLDNISNVSKSSGDLRDQQSEEPSTLLDNRSTVRKNPISCEGQQPVRSKTTIQHRPVSNIKIRTKLSKSYEEDNILPKALQSDKCSEKDVTRARASTAKNADNQLSKVKSSYFEEKEDTSKETKYPSATTVCQSIAVSEEKHEYISHTLRKKSHILSPGNQKWSTRYFTPAQRDNATIYHRLFEKKRNEETQNTQCFGEFEQINASSEVGNDQTSTTDQIIGDKDNLTTLYIQKHCKQISKRPDIYLARNIILFENSARHLKRVEIGRKKMNGKHEKVIMMVGATGAGKTRLINALFNHIVGVKYSGKVKLCLVKESDREKPANQAFSQTDWITGYTIYHDECFTIPYTVTIIDTPGFGDTSGIIKDNEIPKRLHEFFSTKGDNGIDQIDAVGFVIQSSLPRLTAMQKYIFNSILGLFGKDIEDNIFLMFTFADGQKPLAMSAIQEVSLPYRNYYLFNNGSLYETNMNVVSNAFWEIGVESFCKFLKDVAETDPKTICLTKEVLKFRYRQETALQSIQRNMYLGLNMIESLQREKQVLIQHQKDIEKNRSFTYWATEQYICETKVHDGFVAINCKACHVTCYEAVVKGRDREEFLTICIDGSCSTCPEKCDISMHKAEQISYVFKRREVQQTSNFLKKKYEESLGKKMDTQRAIEECSRQMDKVYDETLNLVEEARLCEVKLRQIALKPDALSIKDYIDLLIEAEKGKSDDNSVERLESLNQFKELRKLKRSVLSGDFKPFDEYFDQSDDAVLTESKIDHEPDDIEPKNYELFQVNKMITLLVIRRVFLPVICGNYNFIIM